MAYNTYGTKLISRELDNVKVYYIYNGHSGVTGILSSTGAVIASYYEVFDMSGEGGEYNVKFTSPDGMYEAVYDSRTGNRVTSAINMGTYNFFGPSNPSRHNDYDINPYYIYGNTINDKALGAEGAIKMAANNLTKYNSNSDAVRKYNQLFVRLNPSFTYPPETSFLYEEPYQFRP